MITVELSELDAQVFKTFQKHYAIIGLLESVGTFDLKSGSITIHFDANGHIASVKKEQHYKPSYPHVDNIDVVV